MRTGALIMVAIAGLFAPAAQAGWTGWPVAPLHRQHPIRGSFLDPRIAGYHQGVDISVNDDRPEKGHPHGRTHRVYAVEAGAVFDLHDGGLPCRSRNLRIGSFQYWHVDAVVSAGQHVSAGRMIGWTCLGNWHVHLGETENGRWVNPLRAGSVLRPYADSARPFIHAIRFLTPTGIGLAADSLHGIVDVRGWIDDPQSFRGWFQGEYAILYTPLHPYGIRISLRRLTDGAVVLARTVFVSATIPAVPFTYHYAPGTRHVAAGTCFARLFQERPFSCRSVFWFHLFATPFGRYWDTRAFRNGAYRLTVSAWDTHGNRRGQATLVRLRN